MNGNKVLVDTNVVIYFFNGNIEIKQLLSGKDLVLASISEIELLSFTGITKADKILLLDFISQCYVVELEKGIKDLAIDLRGKYSLKTPDAIVAASAIDLGLPLFTADKAFRKIKELDLFLIQL